MIDITGPPWFAYGLTYGYTLEFNGKTIDVHVYTPFAKINNEMITSLHIYLQYCNNYEDMIAQKIFGLLVSLNK